MSFTHSGFKYFNSDFGIFQILCKSESVRHWFTFSSDYARCVALHFYSCDVATIWEQSKTCKSYLYRTDFAKK